MGSNLAKQFIDIIDSVETGELKMTPSEWAEKNVSLTSDVSSVTGKFRYDITPYMREIVDTCDPYHPAKIVGLMFAAQLGKSQGLLVNAILYLIANAPGNMLSLSRDDTLSREFFESRLDPAIRSAGIQHLIRPNTIRKRNSRTGDTSQSKEFAGGRLYGGGMQSIKKLIRQRSIKYGFFDDYDAAPKADKEEGDTFTLLQKRFNTFKNEMKQYYISTPTVSPSNVEEVYLKGDQRHWFVPCPCCGVYIELLWVEDKDRDHGIMYDLDDGRLIEDSVRYVCQECGDSFKESKKYEINLKGKWVPTAEPEQPGIQTYYMSALYSAPHMFGWKEFVYEWLSIFNKGNESQSKKKAFYNQVLGLPWVEREEQIKEERLIKNTRDYPVGVIPTQLSRDDGNGEIILITLTCDLNGFEDDARLDYDIWAHSVSGSIYSIDQGSIGTFQRGIHKKEVEGRIKWTYKHNEEYSVWPVLEKILTKEYMTQDGTQRLITVSGIDTGYCAKQAYSFINNYTGAGMMFGLKGDGKEKNFVKFNNNDAKYKVGKERSKLYLLNSNKLKDDLSEMINLVWDKDIDQPDGFMNFPQPKDGKYTSKYFEEFEAEQKIFESNDDGDPIGWRWDKKTSDASNHFFDIGYYHLGLRTIFAQAFCSRKPHLIKNADWSDFANIMIKYL